MSIAGHARNAEHMYRCPSTTPGPTAFADAVGQLAAANPRNLLAAEHATSPQPLAKPASASVSGEGFLAGTAPMQVWPFQQTASLQSPPGRAMAPKRSYACGTRQASRWLSINAGSRSGSSQSPPWQPDMPVPVQPRAAAAGHYLLHTLLYSAQLCHLQSCWTLFGPQKGVQFCTGPKLLNRQLLFAALTE